MLIVILPRRKIRLRDWKERGVDETGRTQELPIVESAVEIKLCCEQKATIKGLTE